jgi:hypothetical protein
MGRSGYPPTDRQVCYHPTEILWICGFYYLKVVRKGPVRKHTGPSINNPLNGLFLRLLDYLSWAGA